ncbi:MAG: cytochrome-c oxidase, cbb3-type subunit III [Rhodobacterales bacterium]|nr:MAG: cytochrome-c oxidase, cbb3-type subunit III [Pseudomonadota bacterium]PIE10662.1 MAG: cytochrome-c oxidase, cbb3-type subunit III [Rhodobacterales bacterium]
MAKKPLKKQDPSTTGHSWDGIEEFNNPLPKWWLWIFYACIVWAIWYTIAYPAWPGIKSATAGYAGFSTRAQVAEEIDRVNAQNEAINTKLASVELTEIAQDEELLTYANSAGGAVFKTWCAQCHGSGAAGATGGYPNLIDDDWLWGGDIEAIHTTISHGIRSEDDEDTRFNDMAAYGRDELLEPEEIEQVVNYVLSLSGEAKDVSMVEAGAVVFDDNCSSCHAEGGVGDPDQGAPNLADAIWLYGGSYDEVMETVVNGRGGVMPSWTSRLSESQIRAVATYVHTRGGGQ